MPITKIEARYLAELVESLPEPRRTEIRSRFDAAIRRLDEAGLLERLRHPERVSPETERESLGLAYFGLGIPCPFLEEESCSIHADRPLVCREFLVTSPPEYCADPAGKRVEGVKLPVRLSNVLARLAESGAPGAWIRTSCFPSCWSGPRPIQTSPHASRARVGLAAVRSARRGTESAAGGGQKACAVKKQRVVEAQMDAEEFVRRSPRARSVSRISSCRMRSFPALNLRQVC